MKLNEQIAFLRRQKGITQEELARVLGVTNQTVSKWESAQCCPDITLLPSIAGYFGVSVDELLGYHGANTSDDILLGMRSAVDSAPKGEDFALTLRIAYALHAVLFSKYMAKGNMGWDTEGAIEHAGSAEWGYSCYDLPEITTLQRGGTVLFSNNRNLSFTGENIKVTARILKILADMTNLKTLIAIYKLTVGSEDLYVTAEEIAAASGLNQAKVESTVCDGISELLSVQDRDGADRYRIEGMYMHLIPLVWMVSCVG